MATGKVELGLQYVSIQRRSLHPQMRTDGYPSVKPEQVLRMFDSSIYPFALDGTVVWS